MDRIGWKNLPSKETPLSAENLIQMENNIEEAINGTVLFESSEGVNDHVSLNNSITKYKEIKIDYKVALGDYIISNSKKIPIANGESFTLSEVIAHSSILQVIKTARYLVTVYSITKEYETDSRPDSGNKITWNSSSGNSFKITKVTGYK